MDYRIEECNIELNRFSSVIEAAAWFLGSKFIPHNALNNTEYTSRQLFNEIQETIRKLIWKFEIECSDDNPEWKKKKDELETLISTRIRSYAQPALGLYEKQRWCDILADTHYNVLQGVLQHIARRKRKPEWLLSSVWIRILNIPGFRWIQCDKNLGIKLLTEEEFMLLHKREAGNYKLLNDSEESIISQKFTFLVTLKTQSIDALEMPGHRIGYERSLLKRIWTNVWKTISHPVDSELRKRTFSLPRLKLLIKVHKNKKSDGSFETRPIIPTYGLPEYGLAKIMGTVLAEFVKHIPWVVRATKCVREWLRSLPDFPLINTYDFSNLYGNEPVRETLSLLRAALFELGIFTAKRDTLSKRAERYYREFMVPMSTPEHLRVEQIGLRNKEPIILVFTAHVVYMTIVSIEIEPGNRSIFGTDKFLAMGSSPVAPLSNITLALLEQRTHGWDDCVKGMRRLIDDIIIDHNLIPDFRMFYAYPKYLKLNDAGDKHYLDLAFGMGHDGRMQFWPYMKPFITLPLNWNSFHPEHTKKAIAMNELKRLNSNCSMPGFLKWWREVWRTRFKLACYPDEVLSDIAQRIHTKPEHVERQHDDGDDVGFVHIESWKGMLTSTSKILAQHACVEAPITAWKMSCSLQSIARKGGVSSSVKQDELKKLIEGIRAELFSVLK